MIDANQLKEKLVAKFGGKDMPYCGMSDVGNFACTEVKAAMAADGIDPKHFTWDFRGFSLWIMYKGGKAFFDIDVKRKKAGYKKGVYGFNSVIRWVYADFEVRVKDDIKPLSELFSEFDEELAKMKRMLDEEDEQSREMVELVMDRFQLDEEEAFALLRRTLDRRYAIFKK